METHLKTLRNWKEQKKIRYIGITHYSSSSHSQLEEILRSESIDFVQFNYSIGDRNAERSLLPATQEQGVAVLVNVPFGSGNLFKKVNGKQLPGWAADYSIKSWGRFFLKYILSHPGVTCVIPGTSDPAHLLDNIQSSTPLLPDGKTRSKMADFFDKC